MFGTKTVASITKNLSTMAQELTTHATQQTDEANRLEAEVVVARTEAADANRIARKITDLLA
jgi:glycine cleavage system regulatory protein